MKIQVMSDLHLDFKHEHLPLISEDCDALVLAGDVGVDESDFASFIVNYVRDFTEAPVVMVLGNHDYYGKMFNTAAQKYKDIIDDENVHILNNQSVILGGIKFVGTTLWTDFDRRTGEALAAVGMPDYSQIYKLGDHYEQTMINTNDVYMQHQDSVVFLKDELSTSMKSVVVTHHIPSYQFVDPFYRTSRLNSAFYCDLDYLMVDKAPAAWVCGHTHRHFTGEIDNTKIYCNPWGYPFEKYKHYVEEFVVEV